jgi:hypothetical protein
MNTIAPESYVARLSRRTEELKALLALRDKLTSLPQCKLQEALLAETKTALQLPEPLDIELSKLLTLKNSLALAENRLQSLERQLAESKTKDRIPEENPPPEEDEFSHPNRNGGKLFRNLFIAVIIITVVLLFR